MNVPAGGGDQITVTGPFNAPVTVKGFQLNDGDAAAAGAHSARMVAMLPPEPAQLVGRGVEVERMLELLAPTPNRPGPGGVVVVSAVAGLAGVGKSALALHVAHEAVRRGWFAGGVLFADLRGYDERSGRVDAVAAIGVWLRVLGVADAELPPTPDEQVALFRSLLATLAAAGRRVLMVADNVSDADQVLSLVPAQREHRLLVTSRDLLARVPAALVDLDQLEPGPAGELIVEALTRTRPNDRRPSQEASALRELTGLCGGLPLALEIMAQVLIADPGLRIADAAERLRGELAGAQASGTGAETRLTAVRAAFDLSYRRLPEDAGRLFRLLTLNPGSESTSEAAGILAEQPPGSVRGVLATLAGASLLREVPAGSDRWRMHDLIRHYARELAQPERGSEAFQAAEQRLLEHYATSADAADDHLRVLPGTPLPDRFRNRAEALAWFDTHRTTLVQAVALAADTGRGSIVMSLAASLAPYLVEYARWFDEAIAIGRIAVQTAHADANRREEGMALCNLGNALCEAHRFDEAIEAHNADLAICRELGDRDGEGVALGNLGNALCDARRFDEAIDAHNAQLAICRELADRRAEGMALGNLGGALYEARRFNEAIDTCEQAAGILRELGDRRAEGMALNNLGSALREVGRFDEAIDAHKSDLAICRELGDRYGEGAALDNLGRTLRHVRRFDEAIDAFEQAVAIFRTLDDQHRQERALHGLSAAQQAKRDSKKRFRSLRRVFGRLRRNDGSS